MVIYKMIFILKINKKKVVHKIQERSKSIKILWYEDLLKMQKSFHPIPDTIPHYTHAH